MGRKTVTVTVTDEGRDKGKTFFITEMAAMRAERWAMRVLLALAKGSSITDEEAAKGLAGLSTVSLLKIVSGLNYEDAEPLLAEMLECVQIVPDPSRPGVMRSDIEGDIEEVSTLLLLRAEVYKLHTAFSPLAVTSTSTSTTSHQGRKASRNT